MWQRTSLDSFWPTHSGSEAVVNVLAKTHLQFIVRISGASSTFRGNSIMIRHSLNKSRNPGVPLLNPES